MEAKKRLRRTCEYCGKVGEVGMEIFWAVDPYTRDIQGEIVMMWLHTECEGDMVWAI